MLPRFNIIAAMDEENGIGKNNTIPWKNSADMKNFRLLTTGKGNNGVIMGRKTFESIGRPLPNRLNIVVTSNMFIPNVITCNSLYSALLASNKCIEVYIIGGRTIYEEAIKIYGYLCDKILITRIVGKYDCDVFFPVELLDNNLQITNKIHPEQQYLDLLNKILLFGEDRQDRTKVGTKSIFGCSMEFDLRHGFPLLTTKKVWFKGIVEELLFFISGKTNTKILEAKGVNIWKGNTRKEFLQSRALHYNEGDMGTGYGWQWRHCGAEYKGSEHDYSGLGIDQLANVIQSIKNDPFSRRHIISSWNVTQLDSMTLPPCHCMVQFYVGCENKIPKYLDCCMFQRSGDMFLGVPFNIASYALLLEIIASITGLIARRFIHNIGDAHIYCNHIEQVKEQMSRVPYPLPTVKVIVDDIDTISFEDIKLIDYRSHPKINGEMAK